MLENRKIVLGVSGGIAVYKVCDVVSRLKKLGAHVNVIMTKNATEFVSPLTFQSLSHEPVTVDMFQEVVKWDIEHIALAKKADLFLLAPATANLIGKLANGIADDMLTTTVMATKAPVLIAPAMNTNMYENPIVQGNIKKLEEYGYRFIEPAYGRLACGDLGQGKLADVEEIVNKVQEYFQGNILKDKRVLITAGPTREALDPVRYLTNHSSGKMGFAIAKEAVKQGAEVTLIAGPVNLSPPIGLSHYQPVTTGQQMFDVVKEHLDAQDIIIKTAAVADYRPDYVPDKIKKKDGDLTLTLKRNPDILAWIGLHKKPEQVLVGFAAETRDVMENAKKKLEKKSLDLIVANDVSQSGAGFKSDTNQVTMISKDGKKEAYPMMTKEKVAENIIKNISKLL